MQRPLTMLLWGAILLGVTGMTLAETTVRRANGAETVETVLRNVELEGWTRLGPKAGYIDSFAACASDPEVLLATTGIEVYHSTNGGQDWTLLTLDYEEATIQDLAIEPQDCSVFYITYSWGPFRKSTDAGRTWFPIGDGLPRYGTGDFIDLDWLSIDPRATGKLYAGADSGAYRSLDGGLTWTKLGVPNPQGERFQHISRFALAPSDPNRLYTLLYPNGIYRSVDGGQSWQSVGSEVSSKLLPMAVDPSNADVLYAESYEQGILKSVDGGMTWSNSPGILSESGVQSIAIEPFAPAIVYAATGEGVHRSLDGGLHWELLIPLSSTHDVHVTSTQPSILFVSGGPIGGLLRSNDRTVSWQDVGPSTTSAHQIFFPSGNPQEFLFQSHSTVLRTTDGGQTWTYQELDSNQFLLDIDPRRPHVWHAGRSSFQGDGSSYLKSLNKGQTWTGSAIPFTGYQVYVGSLAFDPRKASVLYAGVSTSDEEFLTCFGGVAQSTNSGKTWKKTGLQKACITDLIVDPKNPATVYAAAGSSQITRPNGGVYKSTNRGATWKLSRQGLPKTGLKRLLIDPQRPKTLYGADFNRLYKSVNGGVKWARLAQWPDLEVRSWAIHPQDSNLLFVATPDGVYRSQNGGQSWSFFGLADVEIHHLAFSPGSADALYVATDHFSVLRKALD